MQSVQLVSGITKATRLNECYMLKCSLSAAKSKMTILMLLPIPVAKRSKARVCGRSLAEVTGSNHAGGMDVCVL